MSGTIDERDPARHSGRGGGSRQDQNRVSSPSPEPNGPEQPDEPTPSGDIEQPSGAAQAAAQAGVSRAVGLISAMVLLSRLLGFARDAIIAFYFGQGAITSAYLYAFTLPDTLWNLVAGGAFFAAFVPVITEYFTRGNEKAAWRVYSIVTTFLFCVLSVLIPLSWIFARPLFEHFLAPGFGNVLDASGNVIMRDHAVLKNGTVIHPVTMAVEMTRIVLPAQYCFFLGTLMMGMLQAKKRFLMPAFGPVIYNAGIILGGVTLQRWLGISAFSWGALIGALIGNLLLQIWAVRGINARFTPSLDLSHPGVKRCGKLVLPVIFGVSLPQAAALVNGIFVAQNEVAKSILEFTNRLMQLPLGIFGQAIGIAVLPTLSAQAAEGNMVGFRKTLNYGVRLSLFLTIPASVLIVALARPLIAVVYQGGAFTAADTQNAVPALIFFAIGVGAWSAQSVVARAFYAKNDTWTPVLAGTSVTFLIFVPLNFFLTHLFNQPGTPLLTRGPALATSIAAIANTLILLYFAQKRFGGINAAKIVRSAVRIVVGCVPLYLAAWSVSGAIHGRLPAGLPPKLTALAELAIAGLLGAAAFLVVAYLFRSPEIQDLKGLVRRRR